MFGAQACADFLRTNELAHIVCSNQLCMDGYKVPLFVFSHQTFFLYACVVVAHLLRAAVWSCVVITLGVFSSESNCAFCVWSRFVRSSQKAAVCFVLGHLLCA